jgi:serine/threonine-protein kinase
MSLALLTEGQLFAGRYRVARCIAAGGMGAVYEVVHLETERPRALKVMLPELVQSADLRDRFKREARVAANVRSEFIVDVFDAGIDDATGMPFLVMELLEGEELAHRLHRGGPLAPREVVAYLRQAAVALDKTHAARIIHRDLKPENLFLTARDDGSPRVKILDFGIAKVVSEAGTRANATRSLGTPLYMAPEQFAGLAVSAATDIYSLGMIAYTLLVGEPYWQEESEQTENVFAFASRATAGPQESATARAARRGRSLCPAFDAWFARATHPDPAQRFARASEAVSELGRALGVAGEPIEAPVAAVREEVRAAGGPSAAGSTVAGASVEARAARPSAGPWKLVAAVGAAAFVLLAAAAVFVVMASRRTAAREASAAPAPEHSASAAAIPSAQPAASSVASAEPEAPAAATGDAAAVASTPRPKPRLPATVPPKTAETQPAPPPKTAETQPAPPPKTAETQPAPPKPPGGKPRLTRD